jgi:hypothetical protein
LKICRNDFDISVFQGLLHQTKICS